MATATKTLTKPTVTRAKGKTRMIVVDTPPPSHSTTYPMGVGSMSRFFVRDAQANKFPKLLGPVPEHLKINSVRGEMSDATKGISGYTVMSIYYTPSKTGYDYCSSFLQMPINCGAVFAYGIDGNQHMEAFHYIARWVLHASGNKVMLLSCSEASAKKLIALGWHGLETWSARHGGKKMYYLAYNMKEKERGAASKPYR